MDPVLAEIIRNVATGGPTAFAVVFAILWFIERSERKEKETKFEERVDRMVAATNASATATGLLTQMITNSPGRHSA